MCQDILYMIYKPKKKYKVNFMLYILDAYTETKDNNAKMGF